MISPEEELLRKQMIQQYMNKLRAQNDPRRLALQQQRQPGREDLAMAGNLAAGLDEAASQMGGTAPSKTLGATATRLNTQAEEGRPKPETKFGYDPKLFKYLDGARAKADKKVKLKYGPGEIDDAGVTRKFLRDELGEKVGEGIITKSEVYQRGQDAMESYRKNKKVEHVGKVQESYKKMIGLINDSYKNPTGPNDIALIFEFMRFLDPGSVVRESEFAVAAGAGGFMDTMFAKAGKLQGKGLLAPEVRDQFKNTVEVLWNIIRKGMLGYEATQFPNHKNKMKWEPSRESLPTMKEILAADGSKIGSKISVRGVIHEKIKDGPDKDQSTWQKLGN